MKNKGITLNSHIRKQDDNAHDGTYSCRKRTDSNNTQTTKRENIHKTLGTLQTVYTSNV